MTAMVSALRTVLRRWATTIVVRPSMSRSSASCTTRSDSASSADVASSRSRTLGSFTMARAIAMRCFCPPLIWVPRSPHSVAYPAGSFEMKPCALAALAAATISSSDASGLPYRMFSRMLAANSTGSCETSPICFRSHSSCSSRMSTPSSRIEPARGS